jgi:hypothetical protein
VDYLAFYQPASFTDGRWRIEYIAPVKGHELTIRREILREQNDHPRAEEEYFKIQLGSIQRLSNPIHAGDWKRFTFLYTTGEYFLKAKMLTDLTVRSGERRRLWKALRDRGSITSLYQASLENLDELPLEVLSALLGIQD